MYKRQGVLFEQLVHQPEGRLGAIKEDGDLYLVGHVAQQLLGARRKLMLEKWRKPSNIGVALLKPNAGTKSKPTWKFTNIVVLTLKKTQEYKDKQGLLYTKAWKSKEKLHDQQE